MDNKRPAASATRIANMPLRRRLVAAISLVMVATLLAGLVLTYAHARRKVDVEMAAAMMGGRAIVEREVEELDATPEAARDLPGLVRVFNGSRHIKARLVDAGGSVLYASSLDTSEADIPPLLLGVLGGPAQVYSREVALSPGARGAVILETDARSEVGEVSGDVALALTVLVILFVLVLVSVNAILARALASFSSLDRAFERIGRGDYAARAAETGPPEFARLSRSCNAMARELGRMDAHARRLGLQLSKVQEEERADLARNLHDEISPFLFAVDVDAAAIRDLAEGPANEPGPAIAARAVAIREATAHMKGEVRLLLGRLRPPAAPDLGLADAIEDLVARARARHPEAAIRARVDVPTCDPATETVIHYVVREALSNALQHGAPDAVAIDVEEEHGAVRARIRDDGRGLSIIPQSVSRFAEENDAKSKTSKQACVSEAAQGCLAAPDGAAGPKLPGFGVIGMRERVEARGGRFAIGENPGGRGVAVEVVVPLGPAPEPDDEPSLLTEAQA